MYLAQGLILSGPSFPQLSGLALNGHHEFKRLQETMHVTPLAHSCHVEDLGERSQKSGLKNK